jgi:chorismate mutase/prephenate dehydratase
MPDNDDLQRLRESIERVDREILTKLKERMELAEGIARAKLESAVPFRDPTREEHVVRRVRENAVELGLDPHEVERLYRLLMEMSIARQISHVEALETVPLRVAYQGVEGSYSQLAAQQHYASRKGGVLLTGHDTLRGAVLALRKGQADFALLPIENTSAGSINETYDLLGEGGITITEEMVAEVNHFLLALPGVRLDEIKTIYSHPQAFAQCAEFLKTISWAQLQPDFDTAGAARRVRASNDRTCAAIASEAAGRIFGLQPIAAIPSEAGHFTRFVEIATEAKSCSEGDSYKTSLILALDHRPGALVEVLNTFAKRGVNLTKLESRPVPGATWRYRFYLDIEGHAASTTVAAALDEVKPLTSELRILGTYPRFAAGTPRGPA